MEDKDKTKKQLVTELKKLRKRVNELERSESELRRVDEDLKTSQQTAGALIHSIPYGLFIYQYEKPDRLILLSGNPEAERLTGIKIDDWIGKEINEIWPEARKAGVTDAYLKVMNTGKTYETENLYYKDEKLEGAFRIRAFRLPEEKLCVSFENITERKRLEKELILKSEIIINMSEGVYLIQADDGIIVYTNPKFEEIFGYREGEMLGKHVSVVNAPTEKSPEETAKEIIEITNKKGIWKGEIQNIRKDGTIFWSYASVSPFNHPEFGSVWAVIHTDITDRKKTEEELENIFNLSPDMIGVFTSEGGLLKVNPSWEKVLGYTQKELLDIGWTNLVHPDDVENTKKEVEKQTEGSSVVNFINRYKCKDGSYKLLEWQASFALEGVVHATGRDITERKKAEEKLKHSQKELQNLAEHMQVAIEQERGLIASELHDEVGQALTGIKMDIFQIKKKISKDQKEIPDEFQRVENLLDDTIQKLRKIYSDLRPSLLEHFGIGEAIMQHVTDFQEQSGIKCTYFQHPEEIVIDENRSIALYRIMQGSINNIKWHSQATKVNIRLEEKGPNLKLTIKDNGKGIEEEQIKSSDSFGLIGMRERARYLGGELKITGIPDKGTTVMLEFLHQNKDQ